MPAALLSRRCALTAPFHPYPGVVAGALWGGHSCPPARTRVCAPHKALTTTPRRYVFCDAFRPPDLNLASRTLSGTLLCGVRTFLPAHSRKSRRCDALARMGGAAVRSGCLREHYMRRPDFRPQTSDLRLQTSDFRPQTSDLRPQTSDFRLRTSDFRPQTSDLRLRTSDFGPTSDFRLQTSDLGPQTSDLRLQTSDLGPRTSDFRPRTSDFRPRDRRFWSLTSTNRVTPCLETIHSLLD